MLLLSLCLFLQLVEFGLLLVNFFLSSVFECLLSLFELLDLVLLPLILLILLLFVVFLGFVRPFVDILQVGIGKLLNPLALLRVDHFVELFACFDGLFITV